MDSFEFCSLGYADTVRLGKKFSGLTQKGDIVCLFGDLGAGKTAFVRGMAAGLGLSRAEVHSPTFTLMNIYDGKVPLYHFDLYRIEASDLLQLGYEEFFYGGGIAVVEWSERLGDLSPAICWKIRIEHAGDDLRRFYFSVQGEALEIRWEHLKKFFHTAVSLLLRKA